MYVQSWTTKRPHHTPLKKVGSSAPTVNLPPPPPMSNPPPPRDDGSPPPRGELLPSDGFPSSPPGGGGSVDTIANEQITAAHYAEFMTDLLLAVRRPRLLNTH